MSDIGKCLWSLQWKARGLLSRRLLFQGALQEWPGETHLKVKGNQMVSSSKDSNSGCTWRKALLYLTAAAVLEFLQSEIMAA